MIGSGKIEGHSLSEKREMFMTALRRSEINELMESRRLKIRNERSSQVESSMKMKQYRESIREIKQELESGNMNSFPSTAQKARVLISVEDNAHIVRAFREEGLISMVAQFLHPDFALEHLLIKEACWVVCNYCSGEAEDVEFLVQANILDRLLSICGYCLMSDVLSNIAFTVANLMSFQHLRNTVRAHPVVNSILKAAEDLPAEKNFEFICNICYMCSNLLAAPAPSIGYSRNILLILIRHFKCFPTRDSVVLEATSGILFFLSAEESLEDRISFIYNCDVMGLVLEQLNHLDPRIARYSLESLYYYTSRPRSEYIDPLMSIHLDATLYRLTSHEKDKIKMLAFKTITNLVCGTDYHREYIASPQLLNILKVNIADALLDMKVRVAAASTLTNYIHQCKEIEQVDLLRNNKELVEVVMFNLKPDHIEAPLTKQLLQLLDKLLELGELHRVSFGENPVQQAVVASPYREKLEMLDKSANQDLRRLYTSIINQYFEVEEED